MNLMLQIKSASGKEYIPVVLDDITLEQERKGAPAKLEFTVVKDNLIAFEEGAAVLFAVDKVPVFTGKIFKKTRDKAQQIKCVAYDQLRYLKNKDYYYCSNKTASDLIKMIAKDYKLSLGTIENTGYILPPNRLDNGTLFDYIQKALTVTERHTNKIFVLYDDVGQLTLRNVENLKTNLLIDASTAENFDYTSSIDDDTFNAIKLVRDNKDTNKREVFYIRDEANVKLWGILQHFDTLDDGENGENAVKELLKAKNRVTRNITINGCFGDIRVRGGSTVAIDLHLGDKIVSKKYFLVERVTHTFTTDHHSMDITLNGGNLFEVQ